MDVTLFAFDQALLRMVAGGSVRRAGWTKEKMRCAIIVNDGFREPMQYFRTKEGVIVPYPLALGRPDWLAVDWYDVDDQGEPWVENVEVPIEAYQDQ
jgi:hypothetical protein